MALNIAQWFAKFFSQQQLINSTGERIIFPFYHSVSDKIPEHLINLYEPRTIENFKKDLDYLVKHFKPISLIELLESKKNEFKTKDNYFHLTFDDGLSEIYDVVAPILIKRKIPATFFINTDFVDNKNLFYRFKASILAERFSADGLLNISFHEKDEIDNFAKTLNVDFNEYLEKEKPYLTSIQIKDLINQGFTIGAHSQNHPLYNLLDENEQISQTLNSVNYLKQEFGLDYRVFSFPFTDDGVHKSFFKAIESHVDLTFGSAGIKKDCIRFNLQRIPMETNHSAEDIIKTQYFYCFLKKLSVKNKITRL